MSLFGFSAKENRHTTSHFLDIIRVCWKRTNTEGSRSKKKTRRRAQNHSSLWRKEQRFDPNINCCWWLWIRFACVCWMLGKLSHKGKERWWHSIYTVSNICAWKLLTFCRQKHWLRKADYKNEKLNIIEVTHVQELLSWK